MDAVPQFLEVPVVFTVGAVRATIGGVSNGASFQQAFAPGMILSVFGAGLRPSTQVVAGLPLPQSVAGVSAPVNGVPAPFYFVSAAQINLQVPYETGAGTAVLGVNNNGHVAEFHLPGLAGCSRHIYGPEPSGHSGSYFDWQARRHASGIHHRGGFSRPNTGERRDALYRHALHLLPQPLLPVAVTVGGVPARIAFAGIPPGLAGATQINFVVPDKAPLGMQYQVVVTVGGIASQSASVTIMQ